MNAAVSADESSISTTFVIHGLLWRATTLIGKLSSHHPEHHEPATSTNTRTDAWSDCFLIREGYSTWERHQLTAPDFPVRRAVQTASYARKTAHLQCWLSKKLGNHAATVALYFLYYSFGPRASDTRLTPAMEAELVITCGDRGHRWRGLYETAETRRYEQPDPDPTEFQLFGGIIGILIVGDAGVGVLYGLARFMFG